MKLAALSDYFDYSDSSNCNPVNVFGSGSNTPAVAQDWNGFVFQMIDVFIFGFGMTAAYLMYEGEFGIFTIATPLLVGASMCFVAFVFLCSTSSASCITTLITKAIDSLGDALWKIVKSLF